MNKIHNDLSYFLYEIINNLRGRQLRKISRKKKSEKKQIEISGEVSLSKKD